jgi:hypothetical protein
MDLLLGVKGRVHTRRRLLSSLPLIQSAPRSFTSGRIGPQDILGEASGIDTLREKASRDVFGENGNWKRPVLAALEDLLRRDNIREAAETRRLLIRKRGIVRE